jgi:hypothetical protein
MEARNYNKVIKTVPKGAQYDWLKGYNYENLEKADKKIKTSSKIRKGRKKSASKTAGEDVLDGSETT